MMAVSCREGLRGFPKDEAKGMELLKKASDLGSAKATFQLAISYCYGMFGFPKDEKQYLEYLEAAAKQGHVRSRYTVGVIHLENGSFHLALNHMRLAAEAGYPDAVEILWKLFHLGKLDKVDLEKTLRAHKAACDEMDSEDRQRYASCEEAMAGNDGVLKGLYDMYYKGFINAKQLEEALQMHRAGVDRKEIGAFVTNATFSPSSICRVYYS